MSLRRVAKELGISPAYLSYMVNGKRPWRPDLYKRYLQIVNTSSSSVNREGNPKTRKDAQHESALDAFDACIPVAGAGGSRTHRPDRRAGANGFEVREAHQDPSAPGTAASLSPPVTATSGATRDPRLG